MCQLLDCVCNCEGYETKTDWLVRTRHTSSLRTIVGVRRTLGVDRVMDQAVCGVIWDDVAVLRWWNHKATALVYLTAPVAVHLRRRLSAVAPHVVAPAPVPTTRRNASFPSVRQRFRYATHHTRFTLHKNVATTSRCSKSLVAAASGVLPTIRKQLTGWPLVWKTWKCQGIWQLSGKCQGFH